MVDIDGDGLISYEEYMLFRTLLSLPQRKVREENGIGEPSEPNGNERNNNSNKVLVFFCADIHSPERPSSFRL